MTWKYAARDEDETLFLYEFKPSKDLRVWFWEYGEFEAVPLESEQYYLKGRNCEWEDEEPLKL